jgi:dTDP-4-amino-4,6-dideoxygalactose transaminase
MHPYWRERYGLEDAAFPVATAAFEHVVSLPLYSKMTDADVDLVVEAAKRALT